MGKNYSVLLFLLFTNLNFSQTDKKILGKVFCNGLPVSNINIVNFRTKEINVTNENGAFSLTAEPTDLLVIVSINHEIKRYYLKQQDFAESNFIIYLENKAEELQEVSIYTASQFGFDKAALKEIKKDIVVKKSSDMLVNNPIPNGTDFIALGKLIADIFSKPKAEPIKKVPELPFAILVSNNFNEDFFQQNLNLKTDEVSLFLQFCEADPKSKSLSENFNELLLMNFLLEKNTEFKKLSDVKN